MSENESNPSPSDPLVDPALSSTAEPAVAAGLNPYQAPTTASTIGEMPFTLDASGLRMTRIGLLAMYYGICAILFAFIFGFLFGIVAGVMQLQIAAAAGVGLLMIIGFGGYLSTLVGQVMCVSVPRESGSKGYALSAVCLQALSILLGISVFVLAIVFVNTATPTWLDVSSSILSFVNSLLALIGYVCFLIFLKHLSLYIDRPDLAASSSTVLKLLIVSTVSVFAFPFLVGFTMFASGGAFMVFGVVVFAWLILCLVTFVRYANLVNYVARAIPK